MSGLEKQRGNIKSSFEVWVGFLFFLCQTTAKRFHLNPDCYAASSEGDNETFFFSFFFRINASLQIFRSTDWADTCRESAAHPLERETATEAV